jgi:hypothetical protein
MHDRMMREADRAVEETRLLIQLKKERLLKNYANAIGGTGLGGVRDSTEVTTDYEKWHVDRGENFSLFAPTAPTAPPTNVNIPEKPVLDP